MQGGAKFVGKGIPGPGCATMVGAPRKFFVFDIAGKQFFLYTSLFY